MSNSVKQHREYFEGVLMGRKRSREDIARQALVEMDRIERALRLHQAESLAVGAKCVHCGNPFPCQTSRILSGD